MSETLLVSPSLLSSNFACLEKEMNAVLSAGADWLHIDVMDGHFVPNITMGAPVIAAIRQVTQAPLDVHLMIENPEKYVEDFAKAGSDLITFHVEATSDPLALIQKIKRLGKRAGITLKPPTDITRILPYIADVDMVLIMTVNPGFSGQSFLSDQVSKIQTVAQEAKHKNPALLIEVDGGINETTGRVCYDAGARVFVAGNFIFKNDYGRAIAQLKGLKND